MITSAAVPCHSLHSMRVDLFIQKIDEFCVGVVWSVNDVMNIRNKIFRSSLMSCSVYNEPLNTFFGEGVIIFIIIITKGWQCKAARERLTPFPRCFKLGGETDSSIR